MQNALLGQSLAIAAFLSIDSIEHILEGQASEFVDGRHYEAFADPTVDVEAAVIDQQLSLRLNGFVSSLPENLRNVVHKHYWLGISQTEIAKELGVTRSAVCHALAKVNHLGRIYFGFSHH